MTDGKKIIEQAKNKVKKEQKAMKETKTIKVSTLIIGIAVFIGLVASFIGGIVTANHYKDTVHAQAVELSKTLDKK